MPTNISPTFVKDIRSKQVDVKQRIYTDPDFKNEIAAQLKVEGFDFFCGRPNTEIEPEHVDKIFDLSTAYAGNKSAVSPLCFAEYCNNEAVVENLIKNQFKMNWATTSGLPQPFTYYEFCNEQGTTDLLKYNPRRENVFVQVYTKCLSMAQLPEYEIRQLCPKVYLKASSNTWKEWNAETDTFTDAADMTNQLEWMQEPIREFVLQNADNLQTNNGRELKNYLKKPTLYWAVIDDTDFKNGDKLNLNDIGRTQVYVGKSSNGIHGRWLHDGGNHTEIIKECLDGANKMIIYDPDRFNLHISLVQARLALAKLREEKCAVFLMKMFDYDEARANEILEITQNQNLSKSQANRKLLDRAEKQHINGKRFLNDENIIPGNEVNNLLWKPKDMAFGMNFK